MGDGESRTDMSSKPWSVSALPSRCFAVVPAARVRQCRQPQGGTRRLCLTRGKEREKKNLSSRKAPEETIHGEVRSYIKLLVALSCLPSFHVECSN